MTGVAATVDPDDHRLFRFAMVKGSKAHFAVESEAYSPAWSVRLRPEIDEEAVQ